MPGRIPAVAAAVAILVVVGISAWLFSTTDTTVPPATDAPAPTTVAPAPTTAVTEASPEQIAQARIDVAQAAIADWAAGDVDGFFGHFSEEGSVQGTPASNPSVRRDLAFYMSLGQTPVVSSCRPVTGSTVQCSALTTDDLSRGIGAENVIEWILRVDNEAIDSLDWDFPPGGDLDAFTLIEEMPAWIAENHPDVFDAVFRATIDRCDATDFNFYGTWCSSPAAAEEMLRLGPEYLADLGY